MSVTFSVEHKSDDNIVFTCPCGAWHSEVMPASARADRAKIKPGCGDKFCNAGSGAYGVYAESEYAEFDVNLSNLNAHNILTAMGLVAGDLCGEMSAEEFARIASDARDAATTDYARERLSDLIYLAGAAGSLDRLVVWG